MNPLAFFTFLLVAAYAKPSGYLSGTNIAVRQDTAGNYKYMIDSSQFKRGEERLADGSVTGFYSYIDANGQLITYKYVSGVEGFRIIDGPLPVAPLPVAADAAVIQRTNDHYRHFSTPVVYSAPQVSYAPVVPYQVVPQQIADTPEVEAAKRAHFKAYAEQLALVH